MSPSTARVSKPRSERDQHTYVARVQDAAKVIAGESVEWRSGRPQKLDPWAEQEQIRLAWRKIAADLRATGDREDVALASDVDAFVDRMPPIRTQQQEIAAKLLEIRQARRVGQDGPVARSVPVSKALPAKGARVQPQGEAERDSSAQEPGRER